MMSEIETYLAGLKNQKRAEDARILLPLLEQASGYTPYLTGTMIGYGSYHYQYDSGHEGDAFVTGFAPRAQNTVVYVMPGFADYEAQLTQLGKYKLGKSCLYLGSLKNVDLTVLVEIVADSVKVMQQRYKCKRHPNE